MFKYSFYLQQFLQKIVNFIVLFFEFPIIFAKVADSNLQFVSTNFI